jgi:hypothetical protein
MALGEAAGAAIPVELRLGHGSVRLRHGTSVLDISLACPRFTVGGVTVGGSEPLTVERRGASGTDLQVRYAPMAIDGTRQLEVILRVRATAFNSVVRKWASYRQVGGEGGGVVQEVLLDDFGAAAGGAELLARQAVLAPPQSYPVFFDGFFAGIEFPMASTRTTDGRAHLAHRPGVRLRPGIWYETRKAVYGAAAQGKEWDAFGEYIEAGRPQRRGPFVIYDNWLSTANAYTPEEMLDLMHLLGAKLYRQNGTALDAFRLVCTWSDPKSIWDVDRKRLPEGLAPFRRAAEEMGAHLGLWISPASCYPFAQDGEWAGKNGYETFTEVAGPNTFYHTCIAGERFRARFRDNLVSLVRAYDLRHIQFDGYRFECPETNHGHEPGALSAEAVAGGMIEVFHALRKAQPRIYLHGAYGGNPSPFWLQHINAFLVYYGDDAPSGRVPAPTYRESYTSGRDQANLQAAYHCPGPIAAHDVYGLYDHTPGPFVNDAVMSVTRGHLTNSLIVNPRFKTDADWAKIARITEWARRNAATLRHTWPLLPVSWQGGRCPAISYEARLPREPYGYAHFGPRRGLFTVRNPWIEPGVYTLHLGPDIGVPAGASGLAAVGLFPEPRVYATGLRSGSTLRVPLAPYETVVLSIAAGQKLAGVREHRDSSDAVTVGALTKDVHRVIYTDPAVLPGADRTRLVGEARQALKVTLHADVTVAAPRAEMLVLLEDTQVVTDPIVNVRIDGKESPVTLSDSESGFAATGLPRPEHWLWLHAPLAEGRSSVELELLTRSETPTVSAWVLASRPGAPPQPGRYPNALPGPEFVSLGSANLLPAVSLADMTLPVEPAKAPVEQIDGVYVDALPADRVDAGSAALTRNSSLGAQPLSVFGRRYLRGLGVHAPTTVKVRLDGGFKRLQAWVGPDQGMATYDRSGLVFQVLLDGQMRWKSGLITRHEPPEYADVDVTGARTLELVALDGVNKDPVYHANWADWGNARLLR